MANAEIVDIAEGIKEQIKWHRWGYEFCVERSYANVREELREINTLRIDVVPWTTTIEFNAVGNITHACEVDILIRKRFKGKQNEVDGAIPNYHIDPLMKVVTDIYEFFIPCQNADPALARSGRQLANIPGAYWQETRLISHCIRGHIQQLRQFTGWIRLTYTIGKAISIT